MAQTDTALARIARTLGCATASLRSAMMAGVPGMLTGGFLSLPCGGIGDSIWAVKCRQRALWS